MSVPMLIKLGSAKFKTHDQFVTVSYLLTNSVEYRDTETSHVTRSVFHTTALNCYVIESWE